MHIPNAIVLGIFLALHHQCSLIRLSAPWFGSLVVSALIANLVTGVAHLLSKKYGVPLSKFSLFVGFFISGTALLSLRYVPSSITTVVTPMHALIIGAAQTLALLPGISRMGLTVSTAIWLGIDPCISFIFSLLCELLLIVVAVSKALIKHRLGPLSSKQLGLLAISSLVSYKALTIAQYGFTTDHIIYVGWYLVGLSAYCLIRSPVKTEK